MDLELFEDGFGMIELCTSLTFVFNVLLLVSAAPLSFEGVNFKCLIQEFRGNGFSAWFNRFWTTAPSVVSARGNMAVLELRIGIKNKIGGTWEDIEQAVLSPYYFQLAYTPHIKTRAIFTTPLEYQTFDIHFEYPFQLEFGIDYKMLDIFLNSVIKKDAAVLSPGQYRCTPIMMDSIRHILHNDYSLPGKARLLKACVENILLGALELVAKDEINKVKLSRTDSDAIYHVRDLIDASCPLYPGNDVLVKKAHINLFKLSIGFHRLFGKNPYEYFLEIRLLKAKELLAQGNSVTAVAYELGYESSTTFIKAFKNAFEVTPGRFQKSAG